MPRSRSSRKSTELTGHYGVAPFQDYELAAPGMHVVLKSYDTLGGQTTNGVVLMTRKFRDANPKVTGAVYAALGKRRTSSTRIRGRAPRFISA